MIGLMRLARRYQRHVVVCHVLRYTPFYNAIKRIIEDGRICLLYTSRCV